MRPSIGFLLVMFISSAVAAPVKYDVQGEINSYRSKNVMLRDSVLSDDSALLQAIQRVRSRTTRSDRADLELVYGEAYDEELAKLHRTPFIWNILGILADAEQNQKLPAGFLTYRQFKDEQGSPEVWERNWYRRERDRHTRDRTVGSKRLTSKL